MRFLKIENFLNSNPQFEILSSKHSPLMLVASLWSGAAGPWSTPNPGKREISESGGKREKERRVRVREQEPELEKLLLLLLIPPQTHPSNRPNSAI